MTDTELNKFIDILNSPETKAFLKKLDETTDPIKRLGLEKEAEGLLRSF